MDDRTCKEYSKDLGIEFKSLNLIKENKYCAIYLAETADGSRIVKKYKAGDPSLVAIEARALVFYHELAENDPNLIDSGEPRLKEDKKLICIGFVEGEALSDVLRRVRKDDSLRERSMKWMRILGTVLRRIYEQTGRSQSETSPFIFEYFDYCSARLEKLPILGKIFFKGLSLDARELADEFRSHNSTTSFIHGDFVFKNIHVKGERVGLIDFANANSHSHPLNDIYNLRFALANMLLHGSFKRVLWSALNDGLGSMEFPEIAHRFYYEYHRRRWLMLKLMSKNPSDLIQGFRGLMTFARAFAHGAEAK